MSEDWKEPEKRFLRLLHKFHTIGNPKPDLEVNHKDEWNEKSLHRKYGVPFQTSIKKNAWDKLKMYR